MSLLRNTAINLGLYSLATLGTIYGEVSGSLTVVFICKPLMMLILSSWFYFNSRRVGDRFTLLIQVGLLFSLIGDFALMFQHVDEFNFLIGLAAFLIAQLCYAMAFLHNIADGGGMRTIIIPAVITVILIAYGYFFASRLIPNVDDGIAIPVGIYTVAICLMGATAAFRFGRTYMRSFLMVMIGALLFIASDSILATNRFQRTLDHAAWSIILTYALAQVLIAAGALVHVLDPDEFRRRRALQT